MSLACCGIEFRSREALDDHKVIHAKKNKGKMIFECGKTDCNFKSTELHLVNKHRITTHKHQYSEGVENDRPWYTHPKTTDKPSNHLQNLVERDKINKLKSTAGRRKQMPRKYRDSYLGKSYNRVLRLNAKNKLKMTSRPNMNKSQKVAKHFKNKCSDTETQAKKYKKMREINNKASKKCRERKAKDIKEYLKREKDYLKRNAELKETEKSLKDQINNLGLLLKNDRVCNYIRQRMDSYFSSLYAHNIEVN